MQLQAGTKTLTCSDVRLLNSNLFLMQKQKKSHFPLQDVFVYWI